MFNNKSKEIVTYIQWNTNYSNSMGIFIDKGRFMIYL